MKNMFKHMMKYWHLVLIIVLLLGVQAYCDLAMPQYTSNIIDVGIQNSGISHILPEKITAEEYALTELFMTDKEKETFESCYKEDSDIYVRTVSDEKQLEQLDDELTVPIILTYQMSNMSETQFKSMLKENFSKNPATASMAEQIDTMSIEDIGSLMQMTLSTKEAEDEDGNMVTYVDVRPMIQQMITSGTMDAATLEASRKTMEDTITTIGGSTLSSMGCAFAIACDKDAGVNVDKIQTTYLWTAGGKMFVMAFITLIAAVATGFLAAKVGAGVGRDLRGNVYQKVVGFSNAEMDKFSTASLITRCTNDVQQIQMVTALMLRMILYAPILGIGGIFKVINTGANMGWIIILGVLVILGFVSLLMSVAMPKFKAMQKLVDALNLVSREILTGLSVIRAFGREKKEEERFDTANRNLTKTQLFTNRVMTFMMPGMMMVMNGLTVAIVWVAAHRIDGGTLQVGAMTAFITYSMQIVMSFLMLTMMSIMLPRAGVAADRIEEVLKTDITILSPSTASVHNSYKGEVAFHHVHFQYPGAKEDVLEDIDFTASPGQTTAIIGSTGCGKSTLINLIPRFYDVTAGHITLDGEDIRNLSLDDLRKNIGFVPQKGVLFSGTIASNLRFGNPGATDAEIEEASQIAQADDFIEEKKDKYESHISQGGSNVSGGQKQRLAIARAIAKKPKVFVFDDSFSALDMKTDAALRTALDEKVKDSCVIIVAQRVSTILHADQILVLDDGKIVGKGTHEELLHNCEVYEQIARSQLSAKELGIEEKTEKEAGQNESGK